MIFFILLILNIEEFEKLIPSEDSLFANLQKNEQLETIMADEEIDALSTPPGYALIPSLSFGLTPYVYPSSSTNIVPVISVVPTLSISLNLQDFFTFLSRSRKINARKEISARRISRDFARILQSKKIIIMQLRAIIDDMKTSNQIIEQKKAIYDITQKMHANNQISPLDYRIATISYLEATASENDLKTRFFQLLEKLKNNL